MSGRSRLFVFMLATMVAACWAPSASVQETGAGEQTSGAPELQESSPDAALDGLFTRRQASRGERRYQQTCLACHRTSEITQRWFGGIAYETAGDLLNVIVATMPEDNPGGLSPEDYADILAFMLSLNEYRAGETELPAEPSLLENVRFSSP